MHPEQENAEQKESDQEDALEGIEQAEGKPEAESTAEADQEAEAGSEEAAAVDPLEALKAELEETKQNWARERADFSNYRKRMSEEMARARLSTIAGFVRSLIPVLDNLDLVLAAPTEDPGVKNFVVGVEMIRGEFLGILSREGIKPEVEVGQEFDPYLMEAVELEESEEVEGEKVQHVYKKAYVQMTDGGARTVLRPATVKVVRGKGQEAQPEQEAKTEEEGNTN